MEHIKYNRELILNEIDQLDRDNKNRLIEYLTITDFFEAPASRKHHNAYPGGLASHCINVYNLFKEKNEEFDLGLSKDNMRIMALLHDIEKAEKYKIEKEDGELVYKYNDETKWYSGDKSVDIVSNIIKLEDVERAAIKRHMGFYTNPSNYEGFSKAMDKHPSIVALHTSDFEATRLQEVRGKQKINLSNKSN